MDRSELCDRFLGLLSYEPYPFQEEGLLAWFGSERGVLVSAPTGMGKTLLAEAAIFEALATGRRMYYTTPLIALTDQKFREFQARAEQWGFPRDSVGLLTGNRKENPDARVLVVVAEILLNHLLEGEGGLHDVDAVVMDEFHYFNDMERGVVWELSLVWLPQRIRLMLLSATVGNPAEFLRWLEKEHGRDLQFVTTKDRRVPLEFEWVADRLLTEHLPLMVTADDATNRTPALVFCFNRDECWEVAERMKGVKLIDAAARSEIESIIQREDFAEGVGPKLRQMLICGVGVHHAGVLPKHKEAVEELFLRKLIPFVVCTETLAAGINLPARSVVLTTLVKGKPGEEKPIFPATAHQIFGRAGRPQFDTKGYVYALAHEDDARIAKWKKKYEQIDAQSKDPTVMRIRKDLERKRPTRRSHVKYWTEGQFKTLIAAGPANLVSRAMIPYRVLIYLLVKRGDLADARNFLSKRFNTAEKLKEFQEQLTRMVGNLAALGYVDFDAERDSLTLRDGIGPLLEFRSIDPLFGQFLCKRLARADFTEKLLALEGALAVPPAIERLVRPPDTLPPGPLRTNEVEPELIRLGLISARLPSDAPGDDEDEREDWFEEEEPRPLTLPEMLKLLFESQLTTPDPVAVQSKWIAGGLLESGSDFWKYVKNRGLVKNEGLVLRHLLRLVILAGEFHKQSDGDPDYAVLGERITQLCQQVDRRYTERFLSAEAAARSAEL